MPDFNGVAGKVGDVSGRVGDISGGIAGRVGDVSGASLAEIQGVLFQDRQAERIACLESKVSRLENEILSIARWLDSRIFKLEAKVFTDNTSARFEVIEEDVESLKDDVKDLKKATVAANSGSH